MAPPGAASATGERQDGAGTPGACRCCRDARHLLAPLARRRRPQEAGGGRGAAPPQDEEACGRATAVSSEGEPVTRGGSSAGHRRSYERAGLYAGSCPRHRRTGGGVRPSISGRRHRRPRRSRPAWGRSQSRPTRELGRAALERSLSGLAPGGVCRATPVTGGAGGLLHHRFTLAPLPGRSRRCVAVCSLWHFPAGRPGWVLPTTPPCGARTFLGGRPLARAPDAAARPARPRRRAYRARSRGRRRSRPLPAPRASATTAAGGGRAARAPSCACGPVRSRRMT